MLICVFLLYNITSNHHHHHRYHQTPISLPHHLCDSHTVELEPEQEAEGRNHPTLEVVVDHVNLVPSHYSSSGLSRSSVELEQVEVQH